jgi:hypothetical protein
VLRSTALLAVVAGGCAVGSPDTRLERSAAPPPRPEVRPLLADEPPAPTTTAPSPVLAAAPPTTAAAPADANAPPPPPDEPVVNRPPPRPDRSAPAPSGPPSPAAEESTAVHPADFPDPYVIRANGSYWAFATQVGLTAIPTMRSQDLLTWEPAGDALRGTPPWAAWGHHWAPAVLQRGSVFVLYYTTRHAESGLQCISRVAGVLPQGPYLDDSDGPFICQMDRGGSIDPSPFVDADGRPHLLWKSEGTLAGEPTRIWVQQLSEDGMQLVGEGPVQLLERRLPWEFPIVEGPSMALVDGRYHLLYSGGRWETAGYAVGHAVCDSVRGPCRRSAQGPVLASRPGEAGPGGQELVALPSGERVLVHHAWEPGAVGYPGGARRLHLTSLQLRGDRLTAGAPWRGEVRADLVRDVVGPGSGAATSAHPVRLAGAGVPARR